MIFKKWTLILYLANLKRLLEVNFIESNQDNMTQERNVKEKAKGNANDGYNHKIKKWRKP